MPEDWRPLKMLGTPAKGSMMIGDSECAMFSIHWQRRDRRTRDKGEQWVHDRLKKLGLTPDPAPPAAERFTACTWAQGVQTDEDKQTTHWFGYAESAGLFVGIKVNGVLPEDQLDRITHRVLPTLRTSPTDGESTWSMHEVSFVIPAGFELAQKHLFLGDVALEFIHGPNESLLVRQVYPGDLALQRRPFEKWLASYPFKEHRKLRRSNLRIDPWRLRHDPAMAGIHRRGDKRLPSPLGFASPRHTDARIIHDQALNRLLIAEHMSTNAPDGRVSEDAIARMNLPLQGAWR